MKFATIFLVAIIFLSFTVLAEETRVSEEVVEEFLDGAKKVDVVVKVEPKNKIKSKVQSTSTDSPKYEKKKITLNELEELKQDSDVVAIYPETHIRAFLGESVSIIQSTSTNNLQANSLNLSGANQIACVIDSGIDFSHPDLTGRNESCVVDCFNKACVENCSVGDDNGHGTHAAGIIGASGGITGVAPNVTFIGVKILDENGDGSGNINDLNNAVDWCVAQNADVISMSLGTVSLFSSNCDSTLGLDGWRDSINAAVAQNISVVTATGNDGNLTGISAPACFSNSIPVGNTYDGVYSSINWIGTCTDTNTVLDQIVCHANRNSLVKLFAPGAMINSTYNTGGYSQQGGTSMSTPMVAGAIALINQYLGLSGQSKTPSQIEDILNSTGESIYDANTALNFSRINVYDAILSLDVDTPNVTLVSPIDNNVNTSINQSFTCNATDWQLANTTLKVWNSTNEIYYNETVSLTGSANQTTFNLTNMSEGSYSWNCLAADAQGNSVYATSNHTLIIGGISTSLLSPATNRYTTENETNFTCNSVSEASLELTNVTFYLWNSTNDPIYNLTENISGSDNTTTFNFTLEAEDSYSWNCLSVNNGSNESWGENNFTITYDITYPSINLTSIPTGETSASTTKTFGFNVSEANIANCSLIINNEISSTNTSVNTSVTQSFSETFTPGTYAWKINCTDLAGNRNSSENNSFTITSPPSSPSGGGGSSGGGGLASASAISAEPAVYEATVEEVSRGYTKKVKANEKINFSIFDFNGGKHLLTVNEVGEDYISLTIESDPINLRLGIGQSVKLNLTSENYYDLLVRLENITDSEAELTMQLINEPIEKVVEVVETEIVEKEVMGPDYFWVVMTLVGLLALVVFVVIKRNKSKKLKGKKSSKKKKKRGKKSGKSKKTKA